jgi:hypothetical protein
VKNTEQVAQTGKDVRDGIALPEGHSTFLPGTEPGPVKACNQCCIEVAANQSGLILLGPVSDNLEYVAGIAQVLLLPPSP